MTEILTVPEVAARLQVKESWVYRHARRLGGFKVGKYWRFLWDVVLERLQKDPDTLGKRTNDLSQGAEKSDLGNGGEQKGNGISVHDRYGAENPGGGGEPTAGDILPGRRD